MVEDQFSVSSAPVYMLHGLLCERACNFMSKPNQAWEKTNSAQPKPGLFIVTQEMFLSLSLPLTKKTEWYIT